MDLYGEFQESRRVGLRPFADDPFVLNIATFWLNKSVLSSVLMGTCFWYRYTDIFISIRQLLFAVVALNISIQQPSVEVNPFLRICKLALIDGKIKAGLRTQRTNKMYRPKHFLIFVLFDSSFVVLECVRSLVRGNMNVWFVCSVVWSDNEHNVAHRTCVAVRFCLSFISFFT